MGLRPMLFDRCSKCGRVEQYSGLSCLNRNESDGATIGSAVQVRSSRVGDRAGDVSLGGAGSGETTVADWVERP